MNIFNTIRSQEWWTYKLPPLLAIGYATSTFSKAPLYHIAAPLLFILISLVIGAIYVSVINDITDLEEDILSGKKNRMQHVKPEMRWLIPICCLLIGVFFEYYYYPDLLSCLLYLGSWIAFSLYSINPFRFKNKGILGVLADASGSHFFTSLLMVASVSFLNRQEVNWVWFIAVGIWSLCYGLRGILWHQFVDRENDLEANVNTYASKIPPEKFILKSRFIFIVEVLAFGVMLYTLNLDVTLFALLLYSVMVFIRWKIYHSQIILILTNKNRGFQILLGDYYQTFFPIAILLYATFQNNFNSLVLAGHVLLFPYPIIAVFRDSGRYMKLLIRNSKV
jgi:4-hydroxybenzoate polyprenyltransferase